MTSFRETYPIDFDLYDKDTQNVLYIEDTSDQTLTLEITNASTQTIDLADLTASIVSSTNYHFALRFRPGTLSSATLTAIALATGTATNWEMTPPETDASGMDVVYLKNLSASLSMDPDTLQTLVFENVGASAGQGSRGTRAELLYTNMSYNGGAETINGNRELHLSVINHRGKQNLPLHVGFVGDNGVLNDGNTANELTLQFSNTLVHDTTNPDASELSFLYDTDATLRSRFILSFDVGTVAAEEWALGSSTTINSNAITISPPGGWTAAVVSGQTAQWELYPASNNQTLSGRNSGSNEHFDVTISSITTAFPTGHTHLHVQYENIPGYWDGQMKVTIEKRPLVYDSGNVGIGTNDPQATLDVNGNIYFGSDREWQLDNGSWQGANIMYRGGSDTNTNVKNFGFHGEAQRQVNLIVDGDIGIGTTDPGTHNGESYRLDVAGITSSRGLRIPGFYNLGSYYTSGIEMDITPGSYNVIRAYRIPGTTEADHIGSIGFFDETWESGLPEDSAGSVNIQGKIATTIGFWDNPTAYFKNKDNVANSGNNGNVGIGTTNPSDKLVVDGAIRTTNESEEFNLGGVSGFMDMVNNSKLVRIGSVTGGDILSGTQGEVGFFVNNGEKMRIDASGNVGIGTTDPGTPLAIRRNGAAKSVGITQNQVGGNASMEFTTVDDSNNQATRLMLRGNSDTSNIEFYRGARGSEAVSMIIKGDSGNVGIGTDIPGATLDINGDIKVKGVKPIIYNTFEVSQDNPTIATPYAFSDYVLAIVGFDSESSSDIEGVRILPARPPGATNWEIRADLDSAPDSFWKVAVLAIRRELVDLNGHFA
ncbi:MAG: hypothetical protein AAF934_02930 [Bacteroidota bacterium]